MEYDLAKNGPLLLVLDPGMESTVTAQLTPEQQEGLAVYIDKRRKRVGVGGLTVLAPKTMQTIETKPGKPDPYTSLRAEERLQVLLSFFDGAQWEQAGSTHGIGLADLNDAQRRSFSVCCR